jgi:hypothetical protein
VAEFVDRGWPLLEALKRIDFTVLLDRLGDLLAF